jgi:hypothetical protein
MSILIVFLDIDLFIGVNVRNFRMSIKSQTPGIASDLPLISKQRGPAYLMGKKEKEMPLYKGEKARTKEGFSHNIEAEMHAGKPQKQSVAIAYSEADRSKKHESHSQHHRHKEHR